MHSQSGTTTRTVGFVGVAGGDALKQHSPADVGTPSTVEGYLFRSPHLGNAQDALKEACDKRPTLICLVGLPYAGLSAHARRLELPIVSPDSIRLVIHGQRYVEQAEDIVWSNARVMVRALFLSGHRAVVLNACNVTTQRRQEWIKPEEWITEFHHIITPFDTCIERARHARDYEMLPVIQRMNDNWEPFRSVEDEWRVRLFERGVEVNAYPPSWGQRRRPNDGVPERDELMDVALRMASDVAGDGQDEGA